MIDLDDGDDILNVLGVVLVLFIVVAVGVMVLAADSASQGGSPAPDAEWELTRINDTYVRITHVGGETVRTENVLVTVDGRPRPTQWTEEFVVPEEYGLVRVDEGRSLAIYWEQTGEQRQVLGRWSLGESTTTGQ